MSGFDIKVRRLGGHPAEALPGSQGGPHLGLDELGLYGQGMLYYNEGRRAMPVHANGLAHWFVGQYTGEEDKVDVFAVDVPVLNITKDAPGARLLVDMDFTVPGGSANRYRLMRSYETFWDFEFNREYRVQRWVSISGGMLRYTFEFRRVDTEALEFPFDPCPMVVQVVACNADPDNPLNAIQEFIFS